MSAAWNGGCGVGGHLARITGDYYQAPDRIASVNRAGLWCDRAVRQALRQHGEKPRVCVNLNKIAQHQSYAILVDAGPLILD